MQSADAIARFVYLAKEKYRLTNHRRARTAELKEAKAVITETMKEMKGIESDIAKSVNLICQAQGEQSGLLSIMTSEDKDKAYKIIEEGGFGIISEKEYRKVVEASLE